jgi:N-acetylneuraminic acid mutarotase
MPPWAWRQAQPQGRLRKPCEGHTLSVVEHNLYVLFGKHEDDHGNPICPPMQVYDTAANVLTSPPFEPGADARTNVPHDREGHTASVVGSSIYVFGGTWTDDEEHTIYLNDLHCLETRSLSWSRPSSSGTAPIEREGHTAATIGGRIFIFGGTWVDDEDNSIYLNDLHCLDTSSLSWSAPQTSGEPPIPREGHTSSVVGQQMVLFGGAGLDASDRSINLNDLHVLCTETRCAASHMTP